MIIPKSIMDTYFIKDPREEKVIRELNGAFMNYFYFNGKFSLNTDRNEVLNACLLSGSAEISIDNTNHSLNNFDFFYLPPDHNVTIIPKNGFKCKVCYIKVQIKNKIPTKFEINHYNHEDFIARGDLNPKNSISTYRKVWTALKNGYFMSGITKIPNEALHKGVLTSVNLEEGDDENIKIYPHIHPQFPELYIFCIDDKKVAITQYLINSAGESICKDLTDGDGLYFPGSLGHMNFGKPTYKNLDYCMYIWIIPTFGFSERVDPITLNV